ncbi:Lactamase-B domain-containing protein [Aphelenchoides bicaudatus]|nr:Lactamase-B domain-containing protein [Aphelenchoides bicaudatus]
MRLLRWLLLTLFIFTDQTSATTEQIKKWIIANKHALPKEAQDAISNASGGEIATALLRMLGFKTTNSRTSINAQSLIGAKITSETGPTSTTPPLIRTKMVEEVAARRGVCPFDATPLIVLGEYSYCRPSNPEDCPASYICDQSFVLGRSICCKEGFGRNNMGSSSGNKTNTMIRTTSSSSGWKTIKPPRTTQEMIILGQHTSTTTQRTPWYIRFDLVTVVLSLMLLAFMNSWVARVTPSPSSLSRPSTPMYPQAINFEFKLAAIIANPAIHSRAVTECLVKHMFVISRLWSTTPTPINVVNVTVIQTGSKRILKDNQIELIGSISLVTDNGLRVLVDTGSASETEVLLRGLAENQVALDDIDLVVVTHPHPAFMGNLNFFGQKPVLFHTSEFIGHHVSQTELVERPYRKLTPNIEIWKTPGQSQRDLSVLVHNVPSYGTMAIVGDLIPQESLLSERVDPLLDEGVWDAAIKRQNANLIICMADWVVAGVGPPFKVLSQYRQRAGCSVNSSRKKL